MWSQIISSSLQTPKTAISPSDDYCLKTIFWLCPEVVIISNTHCMWFMEAQTLTCSIMEKPHTGLDDCLNMLLACFTKKMSGTRPWTP